MTMEKEVENEDEIDGASDEDAAANTGDEDTDIEEEQDTVNTSDDETLKDGPSDPEEPHFESVKAAFAAAEESLDGSSGSKPATQPTRATSEELYESIGATDGIEAMMAESTMAMFDVAQDSVRRAKEADEPSVRELELKIAMQANATMLKFSTAIIDHRRLRQPKRLTQTFNFKK
ncbi:MAG: hypothetical protein QNJ62_13160 [Methyloceanibacter sp.]|nr:hypothetical protein [Methyloceanibacter sp.]